MLITVSDHIEIISYYYPYLLQHMDADSVSHMMHCNSLITEDDYEAITAAPNDRMMNVVILQYIRAMDLPTFSKFTDLLKTIETQKLIATDLENCKHVYVYVYIYIWKTDKIWTESGLDSGLCLHCINDLFAIKIACVSQYKLYTYLIIFET